MKRFSCRSPAFTDFLNRRAHEMSPVETLKLLPDDISLQGIETALKKMILTSGEKVKLDSLHSLQDLQVYYLLSQSRASMVMLGLAKSDNFNAKVDQYFWSQQRVELTDSRYVLHDKISGGLEAIVLHFQFFQLLHGLWKAIQIT